MTYKFEVGMKYIVLLRGNEDGMIVVVKRNKKKMVVEHHSNTGIRTCLYDIETKEFDGVECEVGYCGLCVTGASEMVI